MERDFFLFSEREEDRAFFTDRDLDFLLGRERERDLDFLLARERERDLLDFFLFPRERDRDFFFPPPARFFETDRDADFRPFFFFGGDREREVLLEPAFLAFFSFFFFFGEGDGDLELRRRSRDFDLGLDRPRFLSSLRPPPPPPEADLDGFRRLSWDLERPRFTAGPREPDRLDRLFFRSGGDLERFFLARPAADRERDRFLGAGEEGRRLRSPDLLLGIQAGSSSMFIEKRI